MTPAQAEPRRRGRASRRPRYASHEAQLRELVGQLRERDGQVREALVVVLTGATPRMLAAVGTLMRFVARERTIGGEAARRSLRILPRRSGLPASADMHAEGGAC